jgi:hypothetical protein
VRINHILKAQKVLLIYREKRRNLMLNGLTSKLAAKMTVAEMQLKDKLAGAKDELLSKQGGAVTFEYIIILVMMVAVIVAAFLILRPVIVAKSNEIATFVTGVNIEKGTIPGNS